MGFHRIQAAYGHYEIEGDHLVSRGFRLSDEALKDAKCHILGLAHRELSLPKGCVALDVQMMQRDGFLQVVVSGAREGHYRFIPNPSAARNE